MTLIDGDRIITAQLYDDEHEEFTEKKMSIIDYVNAYTDEGITEVEPCDDCISRQAAKKIIFDEFEGWPTDEEVAQLKRLTKQFDDLPSVTPTVSKPEILPEDCISREALNEILKADCADGDNMTVISDETAKKIAELPSVTPERKKGKWISRPRVYECSECGIIRARDTTGKYNYCPNCGVKMEVKE